MKKVRRRIKVNDKDKLVIEGWMLDLDFDNYAELVLYAFVYGWTKFVGVCFYRKEYFAEWLKTDIAEVEYIVERLCDKGYIGMRGNPDEKSRLPVLVAGLALGEGNE